MKKLQFLGTLAALASFSVSLHAQETLIAGWDFSQYRAGYSAVGTDYIGVNTLWANFSGLDTLGNADGFSGPNDYHFGTFYYDGQYGSSQMIDAASPYTTYWANSGNLASNDGAATNPYYGSTFNGTLKNQYLTTEGQETINPYSVQFVAELSGESFVFEANLGENATETATGWTFSYAGKMASGGSTTISWAYSTDGSSYTDTGVTHTFTTTDTRYALSAEDLSELDGASQIYIRGTLGTIVAEPLGYIPLIDNVAIRATVGGSMAADPFNGTEEGEDGWYYSDWFQWYWPQPDDSNWYYSDWMGWVYPEVSEDEAGFWLWAEDTANSTWTWFYTESAYYPWIYNTGSSSWVWGQPQA